VLDVAGPSERIVARLFLLKCHPASLQNEYEIPTLFKLCDMRVSKMCDGNISRYPNILEITFSIMLLDMNYDNR